MAESMTSLAPCPFGRQMRDEHFQFAPTYKPLNHGSFGTYPKSVQKRLHEVQALSEARPDVFVRYQYPNMLDKSRAAIAGFLGVPTDDIVLVQNATTAINVVLRSLRFKKGDVVLHLSSVYGAVEKTVIYLEETTSVESINVAVQYPIDDQELVKRFHGAIRAGKGDGKNVRLAVFDTISSLPGVRVPYEQLVKICKAEGVLSMIDGAHGVGNIELNLAETQPDFLTSNLHKWLYVPRGCAVFYVPERNQHLIRSSLPTSHGFSPLPKEGGVEIVNPLMVSASPKSKFVMLFQFVATIDVSSYLCIVEALRFRKEVCGGEQKIMQHCVDISNEAGRQAAGILGTEVMENAEKTLTRCSMTNFTLPLKIGDAKGEIPSKDAYLVASWITAVLAKEYDIYCPAFVHAGKFWTRFSGQIYLEMEDYAMGAEALSNLCGRAAKGEYSHSESA